MDECMKKTLEKTEADFQKLSERVDRKTESLQKAIEEVSLKTFEGLRGIQDDLLQKQNALYERFAQMMRQEKDLTRQIRIPEVANEDNMHIKGENLTAYPRTVENIMEQSLGVETPAALNTLWVQGQSSATPRPRVRFSEGIPQNQGASSASHHRTPGLLTSDEIPNFGDPTIVPQSHGPSEESRAKEMEEIRETLKAIKNRTKFPGIDLSQMTLVPGLVLPPKFKMPEFEKFNGTQDPIIHLRKFTRKMANYVQDDKIMIHCFQESLEGGAAEWYAGLTTQDTKTWNDAANLFATHYKHNADLDPTRDTLRSMERKGQESFKEYARRWREVACRVKPPLAPEEYSTIFIKTLENPYYDRLWGLSGDDFSLVLKKGELLEIAIKEGRIESASQKRKEREAHAVIFNQPRPVDPYPVYSRKAQSYSPYRQNTSRIPITAAPIYRERNPEPRYQGTSQKQTPKSKSSFTPIPTTYAKAFAQLRDQGVLAPTFGSPIEGPPFPGWYDPNAKCEYHSGLVGHDIENCRGLKYKIENLLRKGMIDFESESSAMT